MEPGAEGFGDALGATGACRKSSARAKGVRREDEPYEGPYSNPVYKQIAVRNGEINRMTKEDLKKKLSELNLDTRGVKEVLKKRLKNVYKKQKLMGVPVKSSRQSQYDFFLVIDFEATCQEHNPSDFKYEIIEFPIVLIDAERKEVVDEFHTYVKPVVNPVLSQFCVQLTGITQSQVEHADTFPVVLQKVHEWMAKYELGGNKKFVVATDGPWDMARFMHMQCCLAQLPFPRWARKWVNVRKAFSNYYGFRRSKLSSMLENMGLTFEGQQHSGIDDSRNIARILIRLLDDGAELKVNERIFPEKLRSCNFGNPEVEAITHDPVDVDDSADSDSTDEQKKINKRQASAEADEQTVTMLERLNINERTNYRNSGDVEAEGYDDLLAYYALQSSEH